MTEVGVSFTHLNLVSQSSDEEFFNFLLDITWIDEDMNLIYLILINSSKIYLCFNNPNHSRASEDPNTKVENHSRTAGHRSDLRDENGREEESQKLSKVATAVGGARTEGNRYLTVSASQGRRRLGAPWLYTGVPLSKYVLLHSRRSDPIWYGWLGLGNWIFELGI